MRKSIKLIWVFLLTSVVCQAQKNENMETIDLFPEEKVIRLEQSRNVYIDVVADSIVAYFDETNRTLLADVDGGLMGGEVSYNYWMPLRKLEAYTLVPNGKKFKKKKVTEFKDLKVWDGSIFAHDDMSRSWTFPGIVDGAIACQYVEKDIREARFIGPWYFGAFIPVELSRYTVNCPSNMELEFRYFNTDETATHFSSTIANGRKTYVWELKDIPSYSMEDGAPSAPYLLPHVLVFIKHYETSKGQQTLINEVSDLHKWYSTFLDSLDSSEDPELRYITDSLVQGLERDEDKVKAVYYWVQNNIKYIAFEEGWGGFVPRQASEVCSNRYGDCKDMATIIYEMGKMANLPIHLAWIGTRDIPYRYEEVPSPLSDNHMIAVVQFDGEWMFLDATSDKLPFGYPSSFIQGKQALVELDNAAFELVDVPVVASDRNELVEHFYLQIDATKNLLAGRAEEKVHGYQKMHIARRIKSANAGTILNDLNTYYSVGNNKFQLQSFDHRNLDDKDAPLEVDYDFIIPDYVKVIGDEVYVNMQLSRTLENDLVEKSREQPIERDYKVQWENTVELDIPEGYSVSYLPAKSSFNNEEFSFEINYTVESSIVRSVTSIQIDQLMLEPGQFEAWNDMIKALSKSYRELIVLKKNQP